jgi:hypothetical protein
MLTQQELVDRLNQLTLRYNLTWFDIKYDADKAINKINGFMGTKYPKLSLHMIGPLSTYSFPFTYTKEDGTTATNDYEIIKEEYFHSVIIPYIAMEVLSRDEEFTTIYNKYLTEMNDGLFDMFQKEFNSVPFEFRQNPNEGVFFGLDTAQGIIQHNERNLNIPTFKFRVNYYAHDNGIDLSLGNISNDPNNNIVFDNQFITDPKAYAYDESATILYPSKNNNAYIYYYSVDGATAYQFNSWSREIKLSSAAYTEVVGVPTIVKMRSDLNLYAVWDKTPVLQIVTGSSGTVVINAIHRAALVNLVIPEYVNGIQVITIPTDFITAPAATPTAITTITDKLRGAIHLPNSVNIISSGAFNNFQGERIELNEGITTIGANAFANTPNLKEIIIPSTVTTIDAGAFPVVAGKHFVIKSRKLEANRPSGWAGTTANNVFTPTWYAASTSTYTVEIVWGYNGA